MTTRVKILWLYGRLQALYQYQWGSGSFVGILAAQSLSGIGHFSLIGEQSHDSGGANLSTKL